MKILHISPNCTYNDYWGYQDNLLPAYLKKAGHDVAIIVPNRTFKDGKTVKTNCSDYVLNDGVRVIRLPYKHYINSKFTNLFSKIEVSALLNEIKPDCIFFHGLVSTTIFDAVEYKKNNPQCVLIQDNHLDYHNGKIRKKALTQVLRLYYRLLNKHSIRYVDKVYGVTPWRKTYAEDYFKIPNKKTDVLIMGADDEKMNLAEKTRRRKEIRARYNLKDTDFLIVTGGKIEKRKQTDILMKACRESKRVTLLIFGKVLDDIRDEFNELLANSSNIVFIGWIPSDKVYDYFYAADLVFFPGHHSVLWEQACASKVPCVFEKWDGMEHVNNGGNSDFVFPVTKKNIENKINELLYTDKYFKMKEIAESDKTDIYLYSKIAKKLLDDIENIRRQHAKMIAV